jgi:hypothetical protein
MQTGTGMISEDTSGCFVDASIEAYQARFHYDCVKGLVCVVATDGTETCQTATGDGNTMYFKTPSEQVLCLP